MLVFFSDTDTDLTPKEAAQYNCKLISMPYSIDGKTVYPYVDFEEFDARAFYDQLRNGVLPNTSAISEEYYKTYFEPEFAAGNDIFYAHFSRNMSASFEAMDRAVAELLKQYPERKFYAVDTKGISSLSLNMVKEIGDKLLAGEDPAAVEAWGNAEADHFAMYFFADDLKFFKHSGRVSGIAGTMGTLLGIRPIIYINDEGKMVSIGKEKGRAKALARLMAYVDELGDHVKDHRIIVGHTDAPELAEEVAKALKEKLGDDLRIETHVTNPTIGSHSGPNGVGISFHAIHR